MFSHVSMAVSQDKLPSGLVIPVRHLHCRYIQPSHEPAETGCWRPLLFDAAEKLGHLAPSCLPDVVLSETPLMEVGNESGA